jgi:hypothetical protein
MPVEQPASRTCVAHSSRGRVALERDTLWTRCKRQTSVRHAHALGHRARFQSVWTATDDG